MNIRTFRFTLACAILSASISSAAPKTSKPAPKPAPKPATKPVVLAPLPIALPSGAAVEFEVDGGEDDVLGMLKSFARGLEEANRTKPGASSEASGTRGSLLQLIGQGQFSAILKDVRHLHLVVYRLPEADVTFTAPPINGGTMEGGVKLAPAQADADFDAIAFHAKPLLAEGGRRNLQANMGRTRVQMFAFGASLAASRGFGLIAQTPSRIIVARSEGYPDMAALGRLIHINGAG